MLRRPLSVVTSRWNGLKCKYSLSCSPFFARSGKAYAFLTVGYCCSANLPFSMTSQLLNSWNDNLPVKRSRDGQELPADVGEKLCKLMDDDFKDNYSEPTTIPMWVPSTFKSSDYLLIAGVINDRTHSFWCSRQIPATIGKPRKDSYIPTRNMTDERLRRSLLHIERWTCIFDCYMVHMTFWLLTHRVAGRTWSPMYEIPDRVRRNCTNLVSEEMYVRLLECLSKTWVKVRIVD